LTKPSGHKAVTIHDPNHAYQELAATSFLIIGMYVVLDGQGTHTHMTFT